MSGGVFSDVRLSQLVAAPPGIAEVLALPAMDDAGLPVGACIDYWIASQGLSCLTRDRLTHLCYGWPYTGQDMLAAGERLGTRVATSFNAHEEPIVDTPAAALQALPDHRIDFLVCDGGMVFPVGQYVRVPICLLRGLPFFVFQGSLSFRSWRPRIAASSHRLWARAKHVSSCRRALGKPVSRGRL